MKKAILFGAMALALALTSAASAQLTIVDTIPGTFIDISGTGTALGLGDDGEADIATTVGNSIFGAGTARVGNNGAVRFFGLGLDLSFINQAIPNVANFGLTSQVLDLFWDDIDSDTGDVYWQEIGGTLIIQWNDRPFFPNTPDHITAQLQVHSSGPALVQFIYADVEGARPGGGVGATIGYQDGGAGFNDVQWSFDTGGAVSNGTVLSLVPDVLTNSLTTLFADNNGGTPGGGVYFDVTVGANPIEIVSFEVNSTAAVGTAIAFEAYTHPGGASGFENSPAGWTPVATGSGSAAGPGIPTPVTLNAPIVLPANTTLGMALTLGPAAGHAYTNGNGANQHFADANVALDLGQSNNIIFGAGLFGPRVWNGTITYIVLPPVCPRPGDLNGDGVVNAADTALFVAALLAG